MIDFTVKKYGIIVEMNDIKVFDLCTFCTSYLRFAVLGGITESWLHAIPSSQGHYSVAKSWLHGIPSSQGHYSATKSWLHGIFLVAKVTTV